MNDMTLYSIIYLLMTAGAMTSGMYLQKKISELSERKIKRGYCCTCAQCGHDGRPVVGYPSHHVIKISSENRLFFAGKKDNQAFWVVLGNDGADLPEISNYFLASHFKN